MYAIELAGQDDRFAARECAAAAEDVAVVGPGLATAAAVDAGRFRGLAFGRAASELVDRTAADVISARAALQDADLDRSGTVAVRARDVRGTAEVDTQAAERQLGTVLVERGLAVDLEAPEHVLTALFARGGDAGADGVCLLGWRAAESVRDFGERAPTDKPFFTPGSMEPLLARAVANIAGAAPGATVLDPMCGTGGILVEAGLVGADVGGLDAQPRMVRGAARNLRHFLGGVAAPSTHRRETAGLPQPGGWHLLAGDATRLPLPDGAVTAVVFDAPYGRQSKVANHPLAELVRGALAEARRVATGGCVVVGDRPWVDAAAAAGWTVDGRFERRVHRSLTRHVAVLARG